MTEKRDYTDFSLVEIKDAAKETGKQAANESIEVGLEVLSKDLQTGEYYIKKLDDKGEVKKIVLSESEVEALKNEQ